MRISARFIFPFLLVLLSLLYAGTLLGILYQIPEVKLKLEECLLPSNHPLQENLKSLFTNKAMFNSPKSLSHEGFKVNRRVHRGLMVAGHPSISGYLIKKFESKVPQEEQLQNFLRRVNGARALSDFIHVNQLKHIVVPQKWIYRLPKRFTNRKTGEEAYVLIVEKMDIYGGGLNPNGDLAKKYSTIDKEVLKEICTVLYTFRGLDSVLHNLPFTYQDQIAFIDTDKWEEERNGYLRRIKPFLSKENQKYAARIFADLRKQEI